MLHANTHRKIFIENLQNWHLLRVQIFNASIFNAQISNLEISRHELTLIDKPKYKNLMPWKIFKQNTFNKKQDVPNL